MFSYENIFYVNKNLQYFTNKKSLIFKSLFLYPVKNNIGVGFAITLNF